MEIIAKRNIYKFYIPLILWNLIFLSMGVFMIHLLLTTIIPKLILVTLFGLGIIISINIAYIKYAPAIVLNKKGISIKNKFYNWNEISSYQLTAKSGTVFNSGECTILIFKDETFIEIYDDFYTNAKEMKILIEEIHSNNQKKIPAQLAEIDIDLEIFTIYKGNPILCFTGFSMWSLLLFIPLLVMLKKNSIYVKPLLIFNPLTIFWFIFHARMMNYFEISENFIIIKNHYFFWKKKIIRIADIRQVHLIRPYKRPNTLRILFNDFSTKTYIAGSLTTSTWKELKTNLDHKNIFVRNDFFL
ncbi:EbsA family protein [Flavobacterium sp. 7A]|uniref:EbsA family protein n=1 Tax=Flavobacterium sp. 7A TaxID=2940571 RepID=UPI0022260B02|nr:EbsA family protein [Flavobacterium sp. 7A]MCW2121055.1 hypothetical protein [Flavobacterium sp. 7A]